jgi:hypothetical protein
MLNIQLTLCLDGPEPSRASAPVRNRASTRQSTVHPDDSVSNGGYRQHRPCESDAEVAPEPQPTTVASCHSMATRPPGLATRATPLPLVTMSQILETAPGPQPTTAARLIAEGIRQLCLATPARALAPALSRNHTLARTCAPPTPTNQPLSTALAAL